jgi:hypothetical protein
MNIQAVHFALIKQSAGLARRAHRGCDDATARRWAKKCLELIAEYRRRYGQEQATRDATRETNQISLV